MDTMALLLNRPVTSMSVAKAAPLLSVAARTDIE
jgi:hypothetical protein